MSTWIWSGKTALLWGTALFVMAFVPIVVWQYRRYGAWNLRRLLGTAALTLYGVALVTYTWLPLPPRSEQWCRENATAANFVPFRMVSDIANAHQRAGSLAATLTSVTVLQVVFNVLLFVPLGLAMRRYFHRSITVSALAGLAVTVLIETTQLTGLWGWYPCAYRTFDVDDLILNTTGALLGALLAPLLLGWMPRARALEASRLQARPVTSLRRWTGQLVDVAVVIALSTAATVGLRTVRLLLGMPADAPHWLEVLLGLIIPWIVVFIIPPWTNLAASPGQTAVWLTPVWIRDARVTNGRLRQRLLRANLTATPWLLLSAFDLVTQRGHVQEVAWIAPAIFSIALVPFTRTHRSLSGLVTGAEMRDIREVVAPDELA